MIVRAVSALGAALLLLCGWAGGAAAAPFAAPHAYDPFATAAVTQPRIISRKAWGADESLRFDAHGQERRKPEFWPVQKIIVHHTDTQNNDPDPRATVRAIYRDDVRLQGLADIPYNFLIDENGRIYEGRYSRQYGRGETPTGEDRNGNGVSGFHAVDANSGTVGVALLGSLDQQNATPRARAALERLVAWIAATHNIDPLGSSLYHNPTRGLERTFPNIAGHRDVGATDCPGQAVYDTLPQIRADVARLMAGERLPWPKRSSGPRHEPLTVAMKRRRRGENRAIDRVRRRSPIVYSGGGRRREVALTFHHGPGPSTGKIVETLGRLHAAATFFAVGNSLIYFGDGAVAANRAGFGVGNMTESFAPMHKLSRSRQRREIRGQAARLRSLGVPTPKLFTPPYGIYDRRTLAVLRRQRMLMVMWSLDTRDENMPGVDRIVRRALRARPGSIILMHDGGSDQTQTIAALPAIVRGLRSRGYKLVTVPRLMRDDPPRP